MPKVVDHDRRRTEIVLSARQLIGENGSEALTMRALADQCGLANGALRRYFRFKDDLMRALDADVVRRFAQYAEREGYESQRGIEALKTLLNAMLPLDQERQLTVEILAALREHATNDESFAATFRVRMRQLFDRIVLHLEQAREDHQLKGERSLEVTAAILVNTLVGIGMTSSFGDGRELAKYDVAAMRAILESA